MFFCLTVYYPPLCDTVMTSHDACTCRTPRDLTVESLQRLKMEALIPAPADREMWFVIKVLNAQSIAPNKIYHTGLTSREFRVQIPLLTKLIWGSFLDSLSL